MDYKEFNNEIISSLAGYMSVATCNFTAVDVLISVLEQNGFSLLDEGEEWDLQPGGRYYVIKNDSAIFPFIVGTGDIAENGFRIIAAHSDSPCFKLKPNCEMIGDGGLVSLNVEKYGGAIMSTWFDRPLSAAGRVMLRGESPFEPDVYIIDFEKPFAIIPNLAIHFNRAVNDGVKLSAQKDMKPVIGYFTPEQLDDFKKQGGIIKSMIANYLNNEGLADRLVSAADVLDYELALYPVEKPSLFGYSNEFFHSGRIDDLSMAFAGLEALIRTADIPCEATRILAVFDNEETGSATKQGAHSPVLRHIMERLCLLEESPEAFYRALANSFMVSADDGHAWHPNYNEVYDPTNHPVVGGGPVVKINSNCKYMTDANGAAVFHALCEKAGVKMQYFVNHSDNAGGSTLGNISSVQLDIPGVDVGLAIWAMHSASETMAASDQADMVRVFMEFYK